MIIAGNWKMNTNRQEASALAASLSDWCAHAHKPALMILFPPAILLDTVSASLWGEIMIGGQDCHANLSGAHTGDIAAPMLREAGCSWVLIGHSERRQDHGETEALICEKVNTALKADLNPMICVGETITEREEGRASDTVARQLLSSLSGDIPHGRFAIAYEPVWAIGTGKVASAQDVDQMHNNIRELLVSMNADYADVPILYGGSVKADNAADLMALKNVGGALVGRASLNRDEFIAIAEATSSIS